MWKRVTFHADEETSKVLEALSNKDNRSQFIRNAIKFYSDNLAVLTRIEERLAEIERQIADLRQKYNGAGPDEKGRLITFFYTKGGVGKTMYSISTALYAAKMYPSKKVVLVDFDLDFGDTANFLGLEPKITALSWQHIPEDSLKGAELENYLLSHPSGIYLLPAPIPPINEEIFTFQVAQKILTTQKRHFDLVLVDTGPPLRDLVVITVENADRIFLVTTPSISSLRNVYDLVRIFEGLKVDPAKINIILNAVKRSIDTNEIKKYIPYEIALKVPYIKQVEEMHDNYEFALENKRFRLYLDELLEDIMGTPREERGFWAFLKGLVGA